MPKKFTQTADGWIQVEEAPEDELDVLIREIDNLIDKKEQIGSFDETKKLPTVPDEMPELKSQKYTKATKIHDRPVRYKPQKEKQIKNSKNEESDWEKSANKAALFGSLIILLVTGALVGILALVVHFGPLTWEDITAAIVMSIVKVLWWFYQLFYSCCEALFNWILMKCGGSF